MEYIYRGDHLTDPTIKSALCKAIRNNSGKCIRGANANMLVEFENGVRAVVLALSLKKI